MDKLPRWVELWGPVALMLGAMWTMTTRLEDRLTAQFDRLTAQFDGLTARVDGVESRLSAQIAENRNSIQRVESKVDELSGYVRGLHKLDFEEGDDR